MVTARYKSFFTPLLNPLARVVSRLGIHPTAITVTGLLLVFASCLFVVWTRNLLVFCGLVTLAVLFDALDGAVARVSGRVTKFGAYLDAVCDRYAEAAVLVSVALVTGYWVLSVVVLVGSLLTSYAKARTAMEVRVENEEWPDVMERTERCVVLVVGLAASQVVAWRPGGRDLYWWTLLVLAVLTHATVLQRVARARRLIRLRS